MGTTFHSSLGDGPTLRSLFTEYDPCEAASLKDFQQALATAVQDMVFAVNRLKTGTTPFRSNHAAAHWLIDTNNTQCDFRGQHSTELLRTTEMTDHSVYPGDAFLTDNPTGDSAERRHALITGSCLIYSLSDHSTLKVGDPGMKCKRYLLEKTRGGPQRIVTHRVQIPPCGNRFQSELIWCPAVSSAERESKSSIELCNLSDFTILFFIAPEHFERPKSPQPAAPRVKIQRGEEAYDLPANHGRAVLLSPGLRCFPSNTGVVWITLKQRPN